MGGDSFLSAKLLERKKGKAQKLSLTILQGRKALTNPRLYSDGLGCGGSKKSHADRKKYHA